MCDRWRNDFHAFLDDMGKCPPDYQLDRIDNDGNYEPGNCRWTTSAEQFDNKSNALNFDGKSIKRIAAERGLNYYTLREAFRRGKNPLTFIPRRTKPYRRTFHFSPRGYPPGP